MDNYHLCGTVIVDDACELSELWVVDGRIVLQEECALAALNGRNAEKLTGYVFPGLVDVHCHVGQSADGGAASREETLEQLRVEQDAGVLLIRDLGVPGDTSWIKSYSHIPQVIRCGRHIARPKRYLRGLAVEIDDPHQLPIEVERQAKTGIQWVKIVADWIDRSQGAEADLRPLWSKDILLDAVAAAHENNARLACHAFATEGIDWLLEAKVDDIEHATGLQEEHLQECKLQGIALTPTAIQVENFLDISKQATKYPVYRKHMEKLYAQRAEQVLKIGYSGAPLLMGSDAGITNAHGSLPKELEICVKYGLPAKNVMASATYEARKYLGYAGIAEGKPADLVVYSDDPRKNISTVFHPEKVIVSQSTREF